MAQGQVTRGSFYDADPDAYGPGYQQREGGEIASFYRNEVADKDYCKIVFPGNKLTVWNQPAREQDKRRFAREWMLYEQGKDQLHGQTMLDAWGAVDAGSIEIYNANNIKTVEQLAALPDGNMNHFPPGHANLAYRHRQMAQKHLEEKQASAGFDQALAAAQKSQDVASAALEENAELKEQLEELKRRMDATETAPAPESTFPRVHKRKPGGWEYQLSDGKIIAGKKAAEDAQLVLDSIG